MSQEIVVKHLNGSITMKNINLTHENIKYKGAEVLLIFELTK